MSASSIPAVIDALVSVLSARAALQAPDVLISDGTPSRALAQTRLIQIGGHGEPTVTGDQHPAELGGMRREEDYTVRLYCSAETGGAVQKTSRDQAFALLAEVENALRTDATLGAVVRYAEISGGITATQTSPDEAAAGRWCEVAFDVHVTNRI